MRKTTNAALAGLLGLCLLAWAPTVHAQAAMRQDSARVRFGIDGGLGFGVVAGIGDPVFFGSLAATGRIGVQFDSFFALYYQMGGWLLGRQGATAYGTTGVWSHTVNVDFTFGNAFQIGAGAGVDLIGNPLTPDPAFDARMAFLIGTTGPGSRGAFALGIKAHFAIDVSTGGLLAIPLLFAGFELF